MNRLHGILRLYLLLILVVSFGLMTGIVFADENLALAGAGTEDHQASTHHTEKSHSTESAAVHSGEIHGNENKPSSHGTNESGHGTGHTTATAVHHDDHGHGKDDGGGVMAILAHHLVDAEKYDLPWGVVDLPKIKVSEDFALKYPAFVKEKHDDRHHVTGYYIPVTKHMIGLVVAAILVIILIIPGMARTKKGEVPHGFGNFLEVLVVFIRDEVVYPNMGEKHGRKWLPLYLTAFFLILFSNLMGMVPWGTAAFGNINMTGGMAVAMLLALFYAGFRYHGLKFFGTFIPHGVPVFVIPLLFPIEIFGLFVKHFALCIRLFANMLAGHTVIGVFLALILSPFVAFASVPGAVAISMLELFVAFLQSYIFVMLASIFVGGTIHGH